MRTIHYLLHRLHSCLSHQDTWAADKIEVRGPDEKLLQNSVVGAQKIQLQVEVAPLANRIILPSSKDLPCASSTRMDEDQSLYHLLKPEAQRRSRLARYAVL